MPSMFPDVRFVMYCVICGLCEYWQHTGGKVESDLRHRFREGLVDGKGLRRTHPSVICGCDRIDFLVEIVFTLSHA